MDYLHADKASSQFKSKSVVQQQLINEALQILDQLDNDREIDSAET